MGRHFIHWSTKGTIRFQEIDGAMRERHGGGDAVFRGRGKGPSRESTREVTFSEIGLETDPRSLCNADRFPERAPPHGGEAERERCRRGEEGFMRARRSLLIAPGLLVWMVAFGFTACGSPAADSSGAEAGDGGEDTRPVEGGGVGGEAGASAAGGSATDGAVGGAGGDAAVGGIGGEGGVGGQGGEGGASTRVVCDATVADPPDDEFLDTNCDGIDGDAAHAVFVSANGSDAASGTMSAPVRSIHRAQALAAESKFAVYVCNGTYEENVVIAQGARIYGGYDCTRDWVRVKDRAIVRADAGLPLTIDSVAEAVVIERLAFRAPSASPKALGGSSQAGAIIDSSNVALSHVEFVAGDGARGSDGAPGSTPTPPAVVVGGAGADTVLEACEASAPRGLCALNATGGVGAYVACDFNGGKYELEGGSGGLGANLWADLGQSTCMVGEELGGSGSFGRIRVPGRAWSQLKMGGPGAPGAAGVDGVGATAGIGALRGALYTATNNGSDGTWGEPGRPGSGGAGGMSKAPSGDLSCYPTFTPGSGGGQGGVGGCGGSPASGGGGGGGSIGLVIVNSRVALDWVSITTGNGGNGGAGAPGGKGQPGGAPGVAGNAALHFRGEDGAPGGDGGLGGASGPGGGGPSIGILYVGTAPKVTEGTFDIGVPGSGGALAGGGAAPIGVTGELFQLAK